MAWQRWWYGFTDRSPYILSYWLSGVETNGDREDNRLPILALPWLWHGETYGGKHAFSLQVLKHAPCRSPLGMQHGTLAVFRPQCSPGVFNFWYELESQVEVSLKLNFLDSTLVRLHKNLWRQAPGNPAALSSGLASDTNHNYRTIALAISPPPAWTVIICCVADGANEEGSGLVA